MASNSPEDVCGVCMGSSHDPRLLPCLHSACKCCVDQLSVTASDGVIACPICRATVRLPPGGAADLPRDVSVPPTSSSQGDGEPNCASCDAAVTRKKPTTWCQKCSLAFCEAHAIPHMMSTSSDGGGHTISPLSPGVGIRSPHSKRDPVCSDHGEAMKYHCGQCDVAICGGCGVVGRHQGHSPIRSIQDIAQERKDEITKKVDTLEKNVLPKLDRSLAAVDNVSTQLTVQADKVRSDIRQAGEKAKEMVDLHVTQMVQEVDDLEQSRLKVLDRQRDELKSQRTATQNAVRFSERVAQLNTSDENLFPLLHALGTRSTTLISTHIEEKPQHHAKLLFEAARHINLAQKTKDRIGRVIPFQASAEHSVFEGETKRTIGKGEMLAVGVRAKDSNGDPLTTGGDSISIRFSPTSAMGNPPTTAITDNSDGSYTISCTMSCNGEYQLEVCVNGEKMANDLRITCAEMPAMKRVVPVKKRISFQ